MTDRTKALIVHADDLGMADSINRASFDALERGLATSASVLVPCRWFQEAADYARSHPAVDFGVHLAVTCEWSSHRWGPVAPRALVPSLVANDGSFWRDTDELARHARVDEVAVEVAAQIDLARRAGFQPSHLDTHMLALFRTPRLLAVLRDAAVRSGIPCADPFGPRRGGKPAPGDAPRIDHMANFALAEGTPSELAAGCEAVAASLRPGTTQLNVHCGFDTDELRALTGGVRRFGAAWRQRDWEILGAEPWQSALRRHAIRLTSWASREGDA